MRFLRIVLLVGVVAVAVVAVALRSPRVQDALVARVAGRVIGRNMSGLLAPDAMRVLLLGVDLPDQGMGRPLGANKRILAPDEI